MKYITFDMKLVTTPKDWPDRTDGFYHNDTDTFSLCQESIQAAFGRTPYSIIVTFSLSRPHSKGWVQIRLKDGRYVIKGQKFAKLACQVSRWPSNSDRVWMKVTRPCADTLAQESAMRLCEIIGQKGYGGSHSFILTA